VAGQRLPWRESLDVLKERGIKFPARMKRTPLGEVDSPSPGRPTGGLSILDARFEEVDFENLFLRRTLIERCRFHAVSFKNTDLTLSCLASEFIDCDFSDADLTCAHLGAAAFFACRFQGTQLLGAELRGATLEHCDFTAANLTGARFDRVLKKTLKLTDKQRRLMVDWRTPDDIGPDDPNP
jgi:uncharacterized protein YjbI with pentapeptide repeats